MSTPNDQALARSPRIPNGDFPYGYPGVVCYFERIGDDLLQCRVRDDLRAAVQRAHAGESRLYAVWPGQYRSDLFAITDLGPLAAAAKVALQ